SWTPQSGSCWPSRTHASQEHNFPAKISAGVTVRCARFRTSMGASRFMVAPEVYDGCNLDLSLREPFDASRNLHVLVLALLDSCQSVFAPALAPRLQRERSNRIALSARGLMEVASPMSLQQYCDKRLVVQNSSTSAYNAARALQSNHIGAIVVQDAGVVT